MRGRVRELWRYPAKSMQGEQLDAVELRPRGLLGDRWWAVRDEERGGIRGAKKIGRLMELVARYADTPDDRFAAPPIDIRLPDGAHVRSDDPDVDARLSAALDHRVSLWPLQPPDDRDHYRRGAPDSDDLEVELRAIFGRTPDEPLPDLSGFPAEIAELESPLGTYFDAFPLHLLTDRSLAAVQALAPDSSVDVRRFRPNVVIEWDGDAPLPEQAWVGHTVRLGDAAVAVTAPCPRCVMVTRGFAELPADRAVLRTVVREMDQNLGVYATVTVPGTVAVGDRVVVETS